MRPTAAMRTQTHARSSRDWGGDLRARPAPCLTWRGRGSCLELLSTGLDSGFRGCRVRNVDAYLACATTALRRHPSCDVSCP